MTGRNHQAEDNQMFWALAAAAAAAPVPISRHSYPPPAFVLPQPQNQFASPSAALLPKSHPSSPQAQGQRLSDSPSRTNFDAGNVTSHSALPPDQSAELSAWDTGPTYQQAHGAWPNTSGTRDGDDTSSQRPRRRRTRQPGDVQWQQHKEHIEKLYMKDNLVLSEVVRLMERDHHFFASEKMYKSRFKIWRWSKNLPGEKAAWMTEKAHQRMPRKTTFYWNHQEWTEEKLLQKYGKALENPNDRTSLVASAPTPNDIHYDTPPSLVSSPQQRRSAAPMSQILEDDEIEQAPFYLDGKPVNLDLSHTTMSDLRILLNNASHASSAGNIDEANADFRDAVSGFSCLLSPTHEETLRAAYSYASFYANCASMDKADAVLSWMSEKHVEKWGPAHEKTYLHYARMMELFQTWGRQERAELLIYKVLDSIGEDDGKGLSNSRGTQPGSQLPPSLAGVDLESPIDPEAISTQLDKIGLAVMTNTSGLDNVLETIIRYCEEKSGGGDMVLAASRAKCELAKLHIAAGRAEETRRALDGAKRSLVPLLVVEREPMSRTIVETARRLSRLYLQVEDQPSCNALFEQVITSLVARRSIRSYNRDLEDAFLLDFVLSIAFEFHQTQSWDACRYWVERGLGLAIRINGRKSSRAQQFEKILDKDDFEMRTSKSLNDLMKCSGDIFRIKIVAD